MRCLRTWWAGVGWDRADGVGHIGEPRDRIGSADFLVVAQDNIARHPAGAFLIFFYVTGWIFFLPPLLGASGFGILRTISHPNPRSLS